MPAPVRFTVDTPENGSMVLTGRPAVSPDGESVLFAANDPASQRPVWFLHTLATGTSRAFPGTEGVNAIYWSFDSRSVILNRSNELWKMDLNSGSAQQLAVAGAYSSWAPEGIVTGGPLGLQWFRPDGSGARWIKKRDEKGGYGYAYPSLIPGGRWLLYNTTRQGAPASVHLASPDGKADREILTAEHAAIYAAPGYLLYLRGSTLTAQAVDVPGGRLRGDPVPVAGPIGFATGTTDTLGSFSASANGVLAFRSGAIVAEERLQWFDRSGKSLGTVGDVADYSNPALSPDGNRLAIGIRDPATAKRDIWIFDLARDTPSRFTYGTADNLDPAWSPDGARLAYTSDRRGSRDLYVKNANGTGDDELLLSSLLPKNVEDWSPDGRWIVFNESGAGNGNDLVVLSMETRKPQDFLRTRFGEDHGRVSPDGKWMAYRSNETGRYEVYVQSFPPGGVKERISAGGGGEPLWRGDGKELFYATLQDPARIMAVDIAVYKGAVQAGIPHPLFEVRLPPGTQRDRWVVTRDGKKFLAIVPPEQKAANSFTVILNWPSLLKKQ
jgi:Tol biopolymer transport system component